MNAAPAYWLKISGTGESPHVDGDWWSYSADWRRRFGSVSMFPRRPRVGPGDRLISYAAGSFRAFGEGRIFRVEEVLTEPQVGPHERWRWMVDTELLIAGPRLEHCPTILEIGVWRRSLGRHSHIALSGEQGELAERLIAAAAERHGALVASGSPP